MRNRSFSMLFVLCTFAVGGLLTGSLAKAQSSGTEKPALYTYVSQWCVPRNMWADYNKMQAAGDESMNKAVADGAIVGWGRYSVVSHQEGQTTHGTWYSSRTMAGLMKMVEGLLAAPGSVSPSLVASKHWDYIMVSHEYAARAGSFKNGYLRVGTWNSKAGSSDPDGKIAKATMLGLLEKLMADGALHGYQIDEEAVHSADPGAFFVVIIANGAEGLDKFYDGLDAAEKANPAAWAGYGTLVDEHGHRDMLARVDAMGHK
jgi:hypothetical protein